MVVGTFLAIGAPIAMSMLSKAGKFYGKHGNTTIGQSVQFGIGYGAATNVGYNLSNQYVTRGMRTKTSNTPTTTLNLGNNMPYGQRKIRVWSRRYRRYIWVYPSRSRYGRSRSSYYGNRRY